MGKVRAKTLGDEELEKKEKEEAEKRRLAKIEAAKAEGREKKSSEVKAKEAAKIEEEVTNPSESEAEVSPTTEVSVAQTAENVSPDSSSTPAQSGKKKKKQKTGKAKERSEKYKTAASKVEKNKLYSLTEALDLVETTHLAKFDETVELHINTLGPVTGSTTLPHGTGKQVRVAILAPTQDSKAADDLLKEIESGKINFDILLATPDAMPKLAKVARILGPKGLMPNPKNGTVTPKPEEVAKQYAGGHMTFKTEAKAPVLHVIVGKLSFGKEKLTENIKALLKAVETKNMKNAILKSTMSPAIRLQVK